MPKSKSIIQMEEFSELKEHLAKAKYCVLNFTAVWCEPCIKVKEILKSLCSDEKFSNIDFIEVDIDVVDEASHEFKVGNIPIVITIKSNEIVKRSEKETEDEIRGMLEQLAQS